MSRDYSAPFELSRRKTLAALGAIGGASAGAGLGTSAFFSDEELFENNRLVAGEFDLKVGWTVSYFDWRDTTPRVIAESDLTDDPGPLVQLDDVKPGDVITHSLDARIVGNPGFLSMRCELRGDSDNGITEPEDVVDGPLPDGSDGTPGGDLGTALRMVLWFDDGDGLPQEIWAGAFPDTIDEAVMAIGEAAQPSDVFDLDSPNLGAAGTAFEVCQEHRLLDPRVNDHVATPFPESLCYQAAETESIGVLSWVPTDIPGVDDNIIQTDRCEYTLRFDAIQCRHNVADDGGPRVPAQQPPPAINLLWYGLPEQDADHDIQFKSQLEFDFVDISLETLVALLEPVNKSRDEKTPPEASPGVLPLMVYDLDDEGLRPPSIPNVRVDDQFSEPFDLVIGPPVWFCDPVTRKVFGGDEKAPPEVPMFPTPLIIYRIERIRGNPGGDVIATKDQIFESIDIGVDETPTHLIEPVVKRRGGEETGGIDRVAPLLLRNITNESGPAPIPLIAEDQFTTVDTDELIIFERYAEHLDKKKRKIEL